MNFPNVLLFVCCCLFAVRLSSQGFLHTSAGAIVDENGDTVLLRGMGLGGWMLQEGYMLQTADFASAQYQIRQKIKELIGESATQLFYDAWLRNHVRRTDIDSLKAWGFNAVRLPMHYNLFTLPAEQEPVPGQDTWLNKGFELTDSLINWCKANEMYVILDLHAAPGGQGYDQGISDYDPSKPSLWESLENQRKTVALWKKLAETYADEPWVAGYDILNEPNWNLPGNLQLKNLYREITDSIRTVDSQHIIFIEGNWFANDFTNLTPPWDSNLVYSPHKYWSVNDQASIQWVLDIREQYKVPIFFGESGENSNVWFRDAIRLLEDHGIGWAWWPMKKVASISGPLSVVKPPAYQTLLNYWGGNGPEPAVADAVSALMQLAENLKTENCIFQKDVIDAMFRQPYQDSTLPWSKHQLPGVVYAVEFDLGRPGFAYFDTDLANYHVTTGSFTAWNQGWSYRNDGVDIEASEDPNNLPGYNVGWLEAGEWMQYEVEVAQAGAYDVEVRIAAGGSNGIFHLNSGQAAMTPEIAVPNTGGWQNWISLLQQDVVLSPDDHKLRFYVDEAGFNLSSFRFTFKGPSQNVTTRYISGITLDEHTLQLSVNKALMADLPAAPAGFSLFINGVQVPVTAVALNDQNKRLVELQTTHTIVAKEEIALSYTGAGVVAEDGTALQTFFLQPVRNTLPVIHAIPGKVEAEDFFFQSGIKLENCSDLGGGQNISYLDPGDYLDYYINVATDGVYKIDYRTAAQSESGAISLKLLDTSGNATLVHSLSFPPTGGWQSWTTTSEMATLPAGQYVMRLEIETGLFNLNWMDFLLVTAQQETIAEGGLLLFPNPSDGLVNMHTTLAAGQRIEMAVLDLSGKLWWQASLEPSSAVQKHIDLSGLPPGIYVLTVLLENGAVLKKKLVLY